MSDELFSSAVAKRVRPLPTFVPRCEKCGIYRRCDSPKMPVRGEGRRGILVVGEYPGQAEDAANRPFVGGSGRYLAAEFAKVGVRLDRDCWLTNALICAPGRDVPAGAVEDCRPNLLKAIRDLNPSAVVMLGGAAIQSVIGHYWKPDVGPVTRWTGRLIPNHKPNCWLAPLNNPAYLLRDKAHPVERLQFEQALAAVAALEGRPWPHNPPDYRKLVLCLTSPAEAASRLKAISGGTVAFDYETTTLKPDGPHAEIVCCSVYDGESPSFAFPWAGPAAREMARILHDPGIAKIGYNLAFEERWTIAKTGRGVANWVWDGMLAAHALDARRGRGDDDRGAGHTGLKFQAYCLLGAPDYAGHLDDLLRPAKDNAGGNDPNRIRTLELRELLTYCAIDSLLEWEVAQKQMAELRAPRHEDQG